MSDQEKALEILRREIPGENQHAAGLDIHSDGMAVRCLFYVRPDDPTGGAKWIGMVVPAPFSEADIVRYCRRMREAIKNYREGEHV